MKKKINSKFMLISAIAIIVMAICAMVLFYDILKKQIQPAKKLDDDIRSRFSSPAKLKNFDYTDEQLVDVSKAIALEEILKRTEQLYVHIQPVMSYMASASVRVSDETLCQKFAAGKEEWMRIRGTLLDDTFDEDDIDDFQN